MDVGVISGSADPALCSAIASDLGMDVVDVSGLVAEVVRLLNRGQPLEGLAG